MVRVSFILLIVVSLMSTGCRNRCANPCGNWIAANPTVAPPPTYSLNIPSVARNQQPYYTPNGQTQRGPINTNGIAPTPANQNGQNGWRASGAVQGAGAAPQTAPNQPASNRPTTFVQNRPGNNLNLAPINNSVASRASGGQSVLVNNGSTVRTASTAGTGVSTTNSPNYQTTSVDERRDATRLAVTDASTVRAPSRNFPAGYAPAYPTPNNAQQTYAGQAGFYRQTVPAYSGAGVLVANQPIVPAAYGGQAVLLNPAAYRGVPVAYQGNAYQGNVYPAQYPTSSSPTVLAESTTRNNTGARAQLGWRDRELSSDRTERF